MKLIIILFIVSLFYLQSQSNDFDKLLNKLLSNDVKEIKIEDVKKQEDYIFLDTRSLEEYKVSHIKDAIWVGYKKFSLSRMKQIDKSRPLIMYCSIGYRSGKITLILKEAGYKNIYNLYGGIFLWLNKGYPIYDSENKDTLKIHPYNKKWGKWLTRGIKTYK